MRYFLILISFLCVVGIHAAQVEIPFSKITYSTNRPAVSQDGICNLKEVNFDADNIGGSGVNADGGRDNGAENDDFTYIAPGRPFQGQTFTTGNSKYGYELTSITLRMVSYKDNRVSGRNGTSWNLSLQPAPILLFLYKVKGNNGKELDGRTFVPVFFTGFSGGTIGNPGVGTGANGPGIYMTHYFPCALDLESNTVYAFELATGNGSGNHYELAGTSKDSYTGGTAYYRKDWSVKALGGDRVFMLDIRPSRSVPKAFLHPGALHTQADLDRMKAKVAAGQQPWFGSWEHLLRSPYSQLGRRPRPFETIVRGGWGNNYTPTQEDAATIYQRAIRYYITGDKAYADKAVEVLNAWSRSLKGLKGDSNVSLGAGICGFQFACAAELLINYPGWAEADKSAFKEMMLKVFYTANFDFLWRHHETFKKEGGNTHYRLNWDTCNMASLLAIGVLCDNRAIYRQGIGFFIGGPGNGRIERAAWYIHPNGLGQGEELGRDQGHNQGGWDHMGRLCQVAWNQGDDLFGYDNNRVLRAIECNAKYNLGNDVPYVPHRNSQLRYTEGAPSGAGRGGLNPQYELTYNHYVNIKGIAAPYTQMAAEKTRPEGGPNVRAHPAQVDWFGFGSLTYTRDLAVTNKPPGGLRVNWSKSQVTLHWWGTARATGYNIKRAETSPKGSYTIIGKTGPLDTSFIDKDIRNGRVYYYAVSAITPQGTTLDGTPVAAYQSLTRHYKFEGDIKDSINNRNGQFQGKEVYEAGFNGGRSISFDGIDDYIKLPSGIANYQDITIAAWVYWNGGPNFQRIFDFGSDVEKCMFMSPKGHGNKLNFHITTTRDNDGTVNLEGPALSEKKWTHVAITIEGDTGTLYCNGVPVDSKPIENIDPLFGQPLCYIGRSLWNNDPFFNGRIDDFRIYNYALSKDGIRKLAISPGSQKPGEAKKAAESAKQ